MANLDKVLRKLYYSPSSPGSFGGINVLYREALKQIPNLKRKEVIDWLKGQITYTLHKPIRRNFKRNPVIAEFPLENFQADLVDLKEFQRINNGYAFILTVIDVFSKKAWAVPLKNKNSSSVAEAFETILQKNKPIKLQTDKGKEFENSVFNSLMKKYSINHFFSRNPSIKCSVVERFNRTLKNKMFKYFTLTGKRKYVEVLPSLLSSYNNTIHRSIGMRPNDVTIDNAQQVFRNLYKSNSVRELLSKQKSSKIKKDTTVRRKYDRGYYPNWTDEIFRVNETYPGINKPQYIIQNSNGQLLNRKLYPEEIQAVKDNRKYRVEKILKYKTSKGIKYYFVKWLNFPESENSWIKSEELFGIDG